MPKCTKCGNSIEEGHRFCSSCGNNFVEITRCSCGEIIQLNDKYCKNCGSSITKEVNLSNQVDHIEKNINYSNSHNSMNNELNPTYNDIASKYKQYSIKKLRIASIITNIIFILLFMFLFAGFSEELRRGPGSLSASSVIGIIICTACYISSIILYAKSSSKAFWLTTIASFMMSFSIYNFYKEYKVFLEFERMHEGLYFMQEADKFMSIPKNFLSIIVIINVLNLGIIITKSFIMLKATHGFRYNNSFNNLKNISHSYSKLSYIIGGLLIVALLTVLKLSLRHDDSSNVSVNTEKNTSNTYTNKSIQDKASPVPKETVSGFPSLESKEVKLEFLKNWFANEYNITDKLNISSLMFDINNDGNDEVVMYSNNAGKKTDYGYEKVALSIYNLMDGREIESYTINGNVRNFKVKKIINEKYKNCLAILEGERGFIISVFALTGNKLQEICEPIQGQGDMKVVDVESDGYGEILTLAFNESSQSASNKYIAVTYKWNGSKYVKSYQSNDTNINWNDEKSQSIQKSPQENQIKLDETFRQSTSQYSITLPSGWKIKSQTMTPNDTGNLYTDTASPANSGSPAIMIETINNSKHFSLKDISHEVINTYLEFTFKDICDSWNEIDKKEITINGQSAIWAEYSGIMKNSKDKMTKNVYILLTVNPQKIHAVSAEGFGQEWIDTAAIIKKSLLSFSPYQSFGTVKDESGHSIGVD